MRNLTCNPWSFNRELSHMLAAYICISAANIRPDAGLELARAQPRLTCMSRDPSGDPREVHAWQLRIPLMGSRMRHLGLHPDHCQAHHDQYNCIIGDNRRDTHSVLPASLRVPAAQLDMARERGEDSHPVLLRSVQVPPS